MTGSMFHGIKCTICGSLDLPCKCSNVTITLCEDLTTIDKSNLQRTKDLAYIVKNKQAEDSFNIGDKVSKVGGDYSFEGIVVAAFYKLSGAPRYVVEDDRGVLHVYSFKNLKLKGD